jgi:hypothetical protein
MKYRVFIDPINALQILTVFLACNMILSSHLCLGLLSDLYPYDFPTRIFNVSLM